MLDLQAVRAHIEQIARDAGAETLKYFGQTLEEKTKSNVFDIVTIGDKASEKVIIEAVRAAYPDHHIVSEEGGDSGADANDAEYYWYIDPIDGTVNFAHGLPFYAVSIGVADRNMQPLIGVVYNPAYDEMYSAARGFGATLNGKALSVTKTASLEQTVAVTGFSPDRELASRNMDRMALFTPMLRGTRRFGSAALDLCFVAAGRLDFFWEDGIHAWDVMAGLLCVEEAGGTISDYRGEKSEKLYHGKEVIASNGAVHAEVVSHIVKTL